MIRPRFGLGRLRARIAVDYARRIAVDYARELPSIACPNCDVLSHDQSRLANDHVQKRIRAKDHGGKAEALNRAMAR